MPTLREVVAQSLPRLQAISEEQAARVPTPGVWSAKQVLGHLIDSGVNNHARFIRSAVQDGLELPDYDQNAWVELGGYQERGWAEVLALWQAFQLHLAHVIEQLPPKSLGHTLRIGDEAATLDFLTADYVRHQLHHLSQVWERTGA